VNVSEGVSAVVDGGSRIAAAKPDIRCACSNRRAQLSQRCGRKGFNNAPVSAARRLTPDEIRQLRVMVAEVIRNILRRTARGDVRCRISIQFEKGDCAFSNSPLARYQEQQTLTALSRLDTNDSAKPVRLMRSLKVGMLLLLFRRRDEGIAG
jgi:hypothetical protein